MTATSSPTTDPTPSLPWKPGGCSEYVLGDLSAKAVNNINNAHNDSDNDSPDHHLEQV